MPSLQIPSAIPKSAAPKSAGALDFEADTWRDAVNRFQMTSEHKAQRLQEFLKTYSTPQAVSQTLKERQRDAPSQYGPVLSKMLSKVDVFLAAGDIAVKGAPESVGLAWTGISLALGSVQDDWATFQLFSGACVDIIGIMISCRLFGKMFATSKGPADFYEVQDQVRGSIPKIYDKILEFSYQMFKYMDRNKFLRITRGILKNNKEEFAGAIKDIKEGEKLMSENATRASQALTSYWQDQSSGKQDQMLSDLELIKDQLKESSDTSREMNDYLKKELEEQRRKTPMDVAREVYAKNKQSLRAVVDTEGMLGRRKTVREKDTCRWIFETDAYKAWHNSAGSSLLWISGGGNMGKSVLVSSIVDQLREETTPTPEEYAFFFFCKSGDDNAQKTDRIMDHLIWYLYDLTPMTLESLDRSNDVVRQYLAGRSVGRNRKRGQQDSGTDTDRILYFEDALPKLADVLKKKVFLVIDALDECSDRKDEELIERLASMTKRDDLKIKILLTSRPESDILDAMDKSGVTQLRMEKYNEDDISKTVTAQLALIPGLTSTERTVARDQICSRAGPYFGYLNPALELLRRPWQRPIEAHLEQLPENLLNMNNRILTSTDPAYLGFLKSALTWTILANGEQKMKINELVGIYSNRFLVEDTFDDNMALDSLDLSDATIQFWKQQIRKAGDTFLDLDEKTMELNLIKPALIKDSFLKTEEQASELRRRNTDPDECPCKACQATKKQKSNFILTAKEGHLEIARQIFKHLNSPLFQRTYLRLDPADPIAVGISTITKALANGVPPELLMKKAPADDEVAGADAAVASTVDQDGDSDNAGAESETNGEATVEQNDASKSSEQQTGDASSIDANQPSPPDDGDKPKLNLDTTDETLQSPQTPTGDAVARETASESPVEDATSTPGEGKNDEDDEVASNADSDVDDFNTPDFAPTSQSTFVFPRYEIAQSLYHLQKVQELWTDEAEKPQEYEDLYQDVLRFFDITSEAFHAWKAHQLNLPYAPMQGQDASLSMTPLHIAAGYGLHELCRRMLEEKGPDVPDNSLKAMLAKVMGMNTGGMTYLNSRDDNGITPLGFAASLIPDVDQRYRTCKVLLEKGALPGIESLRKEDGELVNMEPPFHALLYNKATDLRLVKLFLEHGAKVDELDPYGFNALHDFAWAGSDPAVLDALMEAGADINVRDDLGETPLHKLLQGETLPIELLKRFLYYKADITVNDKADQQALYEVAEGGSSEALKLILAHEPPPEIDHEDTYGMKALHAAARWGNIKCCKLLTEAGANMLALTKNDVSVIYIACFSDSTETVEYLATECLKKDPEFLRQRSALGKTVLRKAAALGKTEIVKLLLTKHQQHLDIDTPDKALGWTPLHIAAYKGLTEVVELLVENGADLHCKDKKERTALKLCFEQWELLNSTDTSRDTSYEGALVALIAADRRAAVSESQLLSAAARKGSIPVLEALLLAPAGQPRADPVLRDEFGWTAIELARQFKRQIAVDFLLQHSGFSGRYPESWNMPVPDLAKMVPDYGKNVRLDIDHDAKQIEFINDNPSDFWLTVFANCPIPASLDRYYYEISVKYVKPEELAAESYTTVIGLFNLGASRYTNGLGLETSIPGNAHTSKRGAQSWGYHGDDGHVGSSLYGYHDHRQGKTETYGHEDVVGCGVDFRKGYIFWTKNGRRLMDKAFEGSIAGRLTPAVGFNRSVKVTTTLSANGPFKWKPGETLDFEADVPKQAEDENSPPVDVQV